LSVYCVPLAIGKRITTNVRGVVYEHILYFAPQNIILDYSRLFVYNVLGRVVAITFCRRPRQRLRRRLLSGYATVTLEPVLTRSYYVPEIV